MPFHAVHDTGRGIRRLLAAPNDVPARDLVVWREPSIKAGAASPAHQQLYAAYKGFLSEAIDLSLDWWDGMIEAGVERGLDPAAAEAEAFKLVFAGPAARGEVVWTVREHWLKCDALNRTLPPAQRVPPQVLLLGWLVDERQDQWVEVLTGMPYWPIGLGADGRWE